MAILLKAKLYIHHESCMLYVLTDANPPVHKQKQKACYQQRKIVPRKG